MKKIFLSILLVLFLVATANAASYYGCASANINADNTFCTTPTGSCTGTTAVSAATALAGTHTLYANGCTITIPSGADLTVTAAKLSNKDDGGDMVDGGGFTVATNASYVVVIQADIETGGTTGAALAITGSAAGAARVTVGSSGTPVEVTGGSAGTMYGIHDTHTVGEVVYYANFTGGTNATAYGMYQGGATGTVVIYGNATAVTGDGYKVAGAGTGTINGNCIGASSGTARYSLGCNGYGAAVTVVGNIIHGSISSGAAGKIVWNPTAPADGVTGHYVKFDGGGTAVFAGKNTDDASKALTTFYYIDPTDGTSDQGSATGGGGGAWGF